MSSHLEIKLKAVIETITDGIYIANADGICIDCNYAFKRLTGIRTDVVGKNVTYLLDNGFISEAVTVETITKRKHVSKVIKYPSGCEALVTGNPVFNDHGELIAVVATIKDLTELNALKNDLKKSNGLAEEYIKTLKDLKAPLNTDINEFIVRDSKMQKVLNVIQRVTDSDATVMICGESGVGKGVIAKLIHKDSGRAPGKFVKIDCGAIPTTLLESELFGYERGAFTGARQDGKIGLFELANNGTLFLDEIGELPVNLQAKILSVLQDRQILRVGGIKPVPIDVRILCATNRDLERMVHEGSFRLDLYYRLNVVPIIVPPLRERKEDILVITMSLLDKYSKKYHRSVKILPEVIDCFIRYYWPGNVRELENTIERLVVLNQDGVIKLNDLPEKFSDAAGPTFFTGAVELSQQVLSLRAMVESTEKSVIIQALRTNSKLHSAAESLDIDISTLLRKCKKLGITTSEYMAKREK